jgi:lipopolysaccharide export system permease protein
MNRDRNNRDVTALSTSGNAIYHAKYYNSDTKTLSDLVVLQRDGDGRFLRRIDARWARWNGETWVLHDAHIFEKPEGADAGAAEDADPGGDAGGRTGGDASEPSGPRSELTHRFAEEVRYETLRTAPEIFGRTQWDVEEMQLAEARTRVEALKEAGLPYREALTDYHRRIAFSLTPLVVTLLSTAIGGRFKKNILLMSLLVSLSLSVVYYVIGMIAQLMAASGTLRPFVAAWLAVVLFSFTGIALLRHART